VPPSKWFQLQLLVAYLIQICDIETRQIQAGQNASWARPCPFEGQEFDSLLSMSLKITKLTMMAHLGNLTKKGAI
jgi:hypothetical protein